MEITTTKVEKKIIGYCDLCGVALEDDYHPRLICESDEWIQTDLCKSDYNSVIAFINFLKKAREDDKDED